MKIQNVKEKKSNYYCKNNGMEWNEDGTVMGRGGMEQNRITKINKIPLSFRHAKLST